MTLYSYCIPCDDGAAPNPFWEVCTLAICKPVIRRNAKKGDLIVATGSIAFGFENKVVYAMEVTDVMTYREYDQFCKSELPNKIPDWENIDLRRKVGDCIYDYSNDTPTLRKSVHEHRNTKTDMGGKNVLLSNHFYYFGSNPKDLPISLLPIVRQGQGHKSRSNDNYRELFVDWIMSNFHSFKNNVIAEPFGLNNYLKEDCKAECSSIHLEIDDKDEELELLKC